uniref:Uncharacterized protein n=1 Tax=Anguilla anguilla TaxID=7936 RepID=A0A0E9QNF7_ANGAN
MRPINYFVCFFCVSFLKPSNLSTPFETWL